MMRRERALKVVLVVVGLLFTAVVYPLVQGTAPGAAPTFLLLFD